MTAYYLRAFTTQKDGQKIFVAEIKHRFFSATNRTVYAAAFLARTPAEELTAERYVNAVFNHLNTLYGLLFAETQNNRAQGGAAKTRTFSLSFLQGFSGRVTDSLGTVWALPDLGRALRNRMNLKNFIAAAKDVQRDVDSILAAIDDLSKKVVANKFDLDVRSQLSHLQRVTGCFGDDAAFAAKMRELEQQADARKAPRAPRPESFWSTGQGI